nr:hypothetical protein [Actinomadura rifamycini]
MPTVAHASATARTAASTKVSGEEERVPDGVNGFSSGPGPPVMAAA